MTLNKNTEELLRKIMKDHDEKNVIQVTESFRTANVTADDMLMLCLIDYAERYCPHVLEDQEI